MAQNAPRLCQIIDTPDINAVQVLPVTIFRNLYLIWDANVFSVTSWCLLSVANKVLDIGVSRPASLLCAAKAPAAVRLLESIRSLRRTSLLKLPEVDWRQGNAHKIHTSLLRIVINFQCSSHRPNEATTIPRHCCQQVTRLCRVNHAKTNLLTVDFSN